MANTKKFVSFDKLSLYDEKIKKVITDGDKATLDAAKAHAEGLASNYDAAGSAKTVQDNLDAEILRAKAAEEANAAAAKQAQDEVDALELVVQEIQKNAYDDTEVRGLITGLESNKADKTQVAEDIAAAVQDETDAREEAINSVENYVREVQTAANAALEMIDALEKNHGDDKTELQGNIDKVAEDVAAIAEDYLKAADKTELEGKIDAKVAQTDYDAKVEEIKGTTDGLQTQINTIMNNPDAEGAINSINEFTQYVADHGTIADGFRTDINKNKEDIAAMDTAYKAADTAIQGRLDVLEAIDHEAYKAADEALEGRVNAEIAKKADATALTQAVEALEGADTAIKGRLDVVEAALGTGEGSVADQIADAKQEAIDAAVEAAAADATSKANAAEAAAKGHADSLNGAMDTRVAALETASATHALASDLTALAGRVTTAEGEIDTLHTEMDAVEALAAANKAAHEANAAAIALKASQADLEAVSGRVTVLETWHNNFTEVSEEEINSLFA